MRIRVGEPPLLPALLHFLEERVDFVSAAASDVEVDVGVLGSFADGGRAELDAHLELWRTAHPGSTVEFVASPPTRARVLKLRGLSTLQMFDSV
jgi:hypothetical protein